MASFLSKIFPNRTLKRLEGVVFSVNQQEEKIHSKTDEELKKFSQELKERISKGEKEDSVLPEAFALVREISLRTLGQRHFDVQLMGGVVLHEGKISEMLTGEGKTLVATLPAYLNALSGKGVHVVTVNDYLARRDAIWMGQIYHALGLKVSCLVHEAAYLYDPDFAGNELDKERDEVGGFRVIEKFLRPITRKEAYAADITYGTNHEFGFDFLKDNLVLNLQERAQRSPYYAIIDEVDSILIDEARTPLIISAADAQSSEYYRLFARIVRDLKAEEDYMVDEKLRTASITEPGIEKVEKILGVDNIYSPENSRLVHFLEESLKAKALFYRDKEYVVKNGEVIIVDEFTGRLFLGRRYPGGLHQAIEAKENVAVREENRTFAQITFQNYFRLYKKIGGMTGTASTSAEEFHKVYNLEVVNVPTNKPMVRNDLSDAVYKTKEARYRAVAKDVKERHVKGQPVLLGTASITNNEILSQYLSAEGVPHEVLNAKNNEREGAIIAQAGRVGAVTVATNMAGRGVDIILGGNPPDAEESRKVKEAGGLHVIGTERHEARRIDNQLRGRSGRQGDSGSSRFFLSLEDDLLRIFGGDKIKNLMETLNFPEDTPIESRFVAGAVNQAQAKVEGINLDIRRHLLDFDDVLNKQRAAVYARRLKILEAGEKNEILPIIVEFLNRFIGAVEENIKKSAETGVNPEQEEKLKELKDKLAGLPSELEPARALIIGQQLVRIMDMLWVSHLENLESLRESVNIRAYGQHEPLVEYRRDAHKLFRELEFNFESFTFNAVFEILKLDLAKVAKQREDDAKMRKEFAIRQTQGKKISRNDPCWCGAKKSDGTPIKYKHCHGK